MKLVCISDTHNQLGKVSIPDGDVLIHAGDLTGRGSMYETNTELTKLGAFPHKHKLYVSGNHDFLGVNNPVLLKQMCLDNGIIYLEDSEVIIDGVRFYGMPWTPIFMNWAFMGDDVLLKKKCEAIPNGIDVLVSHGPPYGHLDHIIELNKECEYVKTHLGCRHLLEAIDRVKPKVSIFGHIHHSSGMEDYGKTLLVNAAICDESYKTTNLPKQIEI